MNPNRDSEELEMLVSAFIDGELSESERIDLEATLEGREDLRHLMAEFQSVDAAVERLGLAGNETEASTSAVETFVVTRQKPQLKQWLNVWRLVPLGAVAALLIGLFLVTTQSAPQATAEQLSPEEFVKPMTDLNRINIQQQRDQELMIRTLGMDLRTLKLELKQLESAGPEDRNRLEKQIETMLQRVEAFEDTH